MCRPLAAADRVYDRASTPARPPERGSQRPAETPVSAPTWSRWRRWPAAASAVRV